MVRFRTIVSSKNDVHSSEATIGARIMDQILDNALFVFDPHAGASEAVLLSKDGDNHESNDELEWPQEKSSTGKEKEVSKMGLERIDIGRASIDN